MTKPKARRTNISIPESLYEAAQQQIPLHYCAGFSDYVASLIRRDILEHNTRSGSHVAEQQVEYPADDRSKR